MAYRFGRFRYDPVRQGLSKDGFEIPLKHKTGELLLFFLNNPGRLLTREEIVGEVWPGVAVSEASLHFQVGDLRKALGASGEALIRTIYSEGYRWEAAVRPVADRPVRPASGSDSSRPRSRFRLVLEEREVQLPEGENILGRDPDGALWIDDSSVSRRHARILIRGGKATLEDLGSKNGTYVRGKRIEKKVLLVDGDEILIGPASMVFRAVSPPTTEIEEGNPRKPTRS
jgi:DNA-binding winged helix-turn-helix (wHTH) protein